MSKAPKLMLKKWGKNELGGLGPDLESEQHKAAAEKAARAREFAKKQRAQFIKNTNFNTVVEDEAKLNKLNAQQQAAKEKMNRAKEYAKQINKPKVVAPINLEQYEKSRPNSSKKEPVQRQETLIEKIATQLEEHDALIEQLKDFYEEYL